MDTTIPVTFISLIAGFILVKYLKSNIYLDWIILKNAVVVHFEDFIKDRRKEMMRILNHFNIEVDETRKECALNLSFEKYKRKSLNTDYSFSEKVIKVVEEY